MRCGRILKEGVISASLSRVFPPDKQKYARTIVRAFMFTDFAGACNHCMKMPKGHMRSSAAHDEVGDNIGSHAFSKAYNMLRKRIDKRFSIVLLPEDLLDALSLFAGHPAPV